ncbi:thiol-disulfide oxidoreductase DCC family protein [Bacillus spongiae]|uniref:Thiol-disulfide oxidoreductase DCC family protein n=1 Tax=Bacillus spongiae TaxID=2683610 RepID=A0ABU8HHV0_9BACI
MKERVVIFDGVCLLCQGTVQFILKHDHKEKFHFASLESDAVAELLSEEKKIMDSVLLYEHGKVYNQSTAVLKILKELRGLWSLLYIFILVPKPLRNVVYRWVAKNRYHWFGKSETCMIPKPEWKNRFL